MLVCLLLNCSHWRVSLSFLQIFHCRILEFCCWNNLPLRLLSFQILLWFRWDCGARKESLLLSEAVRGSSSQEGRWRKSRTQESFRSDNCFFHFLNLAHLLLLVWVHFIFLNFIWNCYWNYGFVLMLLVWLREAWRVFFFLHHVWAGSGTKNLKCIHVIILFCEIGVYTGSPWLTTSIRSYVAA